MMAGIVGLVLHGALLVVLTAICAFDDGRLADWRGCLIPVGLLGLPMVFAAIGAARRVLWPFLTAGVLGLVVTVALFASAGTLVLVPAILYLIAGAYAPSRSQEVR